MKWQYGYNLMKLFIIILPFVLFSTTAYSKKNSVIKNPKVTFCKGVDDEKMPLGTKWYYTCNTDPKTKENVWYRYCYIDENGNAKWFKGYTEFSPKGC